MKFHLFLIVYQITISVLCESLTTHRINKRIAGFGVNASEGVNYDIKYGPTYYPYLACIWISDNEASPGSGAFLAEQWVVTSASAVDILKAALADTSKWQISPTFKNQTSSPVASIHLYTTCVYGKPCLDDLALIKLKNPLSQSETLKISVLPRTFKYSSVFIVGYGSGGYYDMESGKMITSPNGNLRIGYFHIEDSREDQSTYTFEDTMAYSEHDRFSICPSDTGQPLFELTTRDLKGIMRYRDECGRQISMSCATNISHYMSWIGNVTGIKVPFQSSPDHSVVTQTPRPRDEDVTPYDPNEDDVGGKGGRTVKRGSGLASKGGPSDLESSSEFSYGGSSKTELSAAVVVLSIFLFIYSNLQAF